MIDQNHQHHKLIIALLQAGNGVEDIAILTGIDVTVIRQAIADLRHEGTLKEIFE